MIEKRAARAALKIGKRWRNITRNQLYFKRNQWHTGDIAKEAPGGLSGTPASLSAFTPAPTPVQRGTSRVTFGVLHRLGTGDENPV